MGSGCSLHKDGLHLWVEAEKKEWILSTTAKNLSLNLEDATAWGSMNDFRMQQTVLLDWDL